MFLIRFTNTGRHQAGNTNTFCGQDISNRHRNFFKFTIPSDSRQISGVTFNHNWLGISNSQGIPTGYFIIRENAADPAQLSLEWTDGSMAGLAIYAFLRSGPDVYASVSMNPATAANTAFSASLSPLAVYRIKALASAGGGTFVIAGTYEDAAVDITQLIVE